jgi:hypothetical protein
MLTQEKKEKQLPTISTGSRHLEELITGAIRKIGGSKEDDLRRYLPMNSGGYMHHFTLRKMKQQLPEKLCEMINRFIINIEKPLVVAPKRRAPRGSRKKKDQVVLSKVDIDRILQLARSVGDKEIIRKLQPKRELKSVRRELIASIRKGLVNQELWECYTDAATLNTPQN